MQEKIKIGWFTFSCCEDNTIVMTEVLNDHWREWKEIFEFKHMRVMKSKNEMGDFDIAFVEGAIAGEDQEKKVKEIRALAKKLVAVGSCACTGLPAGQRNNFTEDQKASIEFLLTRLKALPSVKKLSEVVAVDAEIPGCPMSDKNFTTLLIN